MKVCVHGFGDFPIFYNHVIEHSNSMNDLIDWYFIFPAYNHMNSFKDLVLQEKRLYLYDHLYQKMIKKKNNDIFKSYYGNIHEDIDCDKVSMKSRTGHEKIQFASAVYSIYKSFLLNNEIEYMIFPHIESVEGKILYAICKELSIKTVIYGENRIIDGAYFSDSVYEVLPEFNIGNEASEEEATRLIENYLNKTPISNGDSSSERSLAMKRPSFYNRVKQYLTYGRKEFTNASPQRLRIRLLNNVPFFRDLLWKARTYLNTKLCTINKLEELPEKFIFYPIQYTPESSINVPSPYFVDQMRLLDLIRHSIPNEYSLVIKEHPACIQTRNGEFIKSIMKKSGVEVIKWNVDSRDIIMKSDLVISVTGTAVFEAFILGKQSICLGESFYSKFVNGPTPISDLRDVIAKKLLSKVDQGDIINAVLEIVNKSSYFWQRPPSDNRVPTMTSENVQRFYNALIEYLLKLESEKSNESIYINRSAGI